MRRDHKVVSRVIRRWSQDRTLEYKPKPGRPRKTSPQTDRLIMRSVRANRFLSATDLKENMALQYLSSATIIRRIKETGEFNSYWAARKPLLSEKNRQKRLAWCEARVNWSLEQWERFLWTDESPYVLRYNAKRRVWRGHNDRYRQNCIARSVVVY